MKHPELFVVPAFMLTDYFLTLAGVTLRGKKYGEHFATDHYELNPMWQEQIAQRKWFSPKHLLLATLATLLLVFLTEPGDMPEPLAQGVLGGFLVVFGSLIGRHLGNLLAFRHIDRKPDEISGRVTMTHTLVLSLSLYQYIVVFVPMAVLAVFSPTPFVIGGLCGLAVLLVMHLGWIRRYNKKRSLDTAHAGEDAG